ncbi:hypothetical protein [Croceicoccus hydrothermalis]|uniref:hypothetical protein n=1 Tax=Croceicoccus hydrothermalis TaxID=2867964 RepID=UPI0030841943
MRRLSAVAMIERRQSPDDKRAQLLTITPTGIEAVRSVAHAIENDASFISWFRRIPDKDREALARILGDFHAFLNRGFLPVTRRG